MAILRGAARRVKKSALFLTITSMTQPAAGSWPRSTATHSQAGLEVVGVGGEGQLETRRRDRMLNQPVQHLA
eukprot:3980424-Pyramimonas_sp.AAC.1